MSGIHHLKLLLVSYLLLGSGLAQALQVLSFSPQGEVTRVNRVVVKFDQAAINFGDAQAPAPFTLSCNDAQASQGTARWVNEREWVFELTRAAPSDLVCRVSPVRGFTSPKGQALEAQTYEFKTGGPIVLRARPLERTIEEEQHFLFELNGPATLESVRANIWCEVQGVGERVPIRLLAEPERNDLLNANSLLKQAKEQSLRFVTFACERRFGPGVKVTIHYDKGVQSQRAGAGGSKNTNAQQFVFRVREPFSANFSCERENAQSPCLPIRPMTLSFSAPVPRALAEGIRLTSGKSSSKPTFGEREVADNEVLSLSFAAPFPEDTRFNLVLPRDFKDASGRSLNNAAAFPLAVATGPMPPLVKFAAAPFGIVERLAEPGRPALLPITVRNVEAALQAKVLPTSMALRDLPLHSDAQIIDWLDTVQMFNNFWVDRDDAAKHAQAPLPKVLASDEKSGVQARMVSLLGKQPGLKSVPLPNPNPGDKRPFEVLGIPLEPGFHVLEVASDALGKALLDPGYGEQRKFYVRTAVLVTNLAVHFKLGNENALAWVTTLDKGRPVAGAVVRLSDCDGKELAQAKTNAQGIAQFAATQLSSQSCSTKYRGERGRYFVSARATLDGVADLAFTWSDWNRGIEPWRFKLPVKYQTTPTVRAHTVLDRSLLRAGETVSMKHYIRNENLTGFGLPSATPQTLQIQHSGSGQTYTQALSWRKTASGGLSAESQFQVPPAAKLGHYQITLMEAGKEGQNFYTSQFRVEEFRLPVFTGQVAVADKKALVNPKSLSAQVQINYLAGGPAGGLPVQVSASVQPKAVFYRDYEAFNFYPPGQARLSDDEDETPAPRGDQAQVVANKLALTLDKNGTGSTSIQKLPATRHAQDLLLEATYTDPNGEIQTLSHTTTLWPAAVVVGIKTEGWVSVKQGLRLQALALDLNGKPQAGVPLQVSAQARIVTSTRKRLVGGVYSYDNKTEIKDLGRVCSGSSDERGLLVCEAQLTQAGEVELIVTARDKDGNTTQAASSVYVTNQGELWFGGNNHDRIDLLPEQKSYKPGDTAKFQVRMPFRSATALVTVEREGILASEVVQLNGQDPTISLKIQDNWGPNVFVSALVQRGRVREVPWYSFFTWGYRSPSEWWAAYRLEGRDYSAPTALVDLSKPAYRLGVSEIRVAARAHQLAVKVNADKESYAVRGKAQITISANKPDSTPAAGAEVALIAVDQALLDLWPNTTWDLLDAMVQRRGWSVETSTAHMEIIGRRHYGRKGAPPGGGGGKSGTRELFDTLLLWNPKIVLDARGQAQVTVPLNDSLTSFTISAVADLGTNLFGHGKTTIRASQDLQIISGLPPLVREGDEFVAQFTLRNTTQRAMKVELNARATLLELKPQTVDIPAGQAREVSWPVTAPAQLAFTRAESLLWELSAKEVNSSSASAATSAVARDQLKANQRIVPAVPLTVRQASLVQVDGSYKLGVAFPAEALPGRGGLRLALQPKLAEGLPGVRDYFYNYPFICLEQKTSKALGLRDPKLWQTVVAQMPSYLDEQGLATYFPPRQDQGARGSDVLTAYILAASHEAAALNPAFALPDAVRAPMERGLIAFIEGRVKREFWSPRKDLDMRKIAALEALSRYGSARANLLGSINLTPNLWPTQTVVDWLAILQRLNDVPQREQHIAQANQILRSRLAYQGSRLSFSSEAEDYWWWLMHNGDVTSARLILTVLDEPGWRDELPRLLNGFIRRQQNGAWHTTTANLWGGLALERFSAKFEATPVSGSTRASLGNASPALVDWAKVERIKTSSASGAPARGAGWNSPAFGAPAAPGNLRNNTMFLPWAGSAQSELNVTHQGSGKPWLTLQSLAAVPLKVPTAAGYSIKKTVTAVEQANPGRYSRGDVLRVSLEIDASTDMTWVVVSDPVPAGASILGGGLGRDSQIASSGERSAGRAWPAFEERSFEAFRAYYEYVPKGSFKLEYTVRLNNVGNFTLPSTRVEAMYAPEMYGEAPNPGLKVIAKP